MRKYYNKVKMLVKTKLRVLLMGHIKLTKQKGRELVYHRNVVASLIKRKAIVIGDVVYAPVKKRNPRR